MKSLASLLKKYNMSKSSVEQFGSACRQDMIKKGYIYNSVFGWEKKEIIESFALDPNMSVIPSRKVYEQDYKETKAFVKDERGNKTGEIRGEKQWYKTSRLITVASENWLCYMQFKKDRWEKCDKEDYARRINTPPLESLI